MNKAYVVILAIFLTINSCGGSGGSSEINSLKLNKHFENVNFPVRIQFLSENSLLVAELATGNLSIYNPETSNIKPLSSFGVPPEPGSGIAGLLVDRDYPEVPFVYIYYYSRGLNKFVLERLTLVDGVLSNRTILKTFFTNSIHNGGAIVQDLSGDIYISTGDGDSPQSAQNLLDIRGKIHKIDRSGNPAKNNPLDNSSVYSLGLRNVFGMTLDNNVLYALENGPDCNDSILKVLPLANYGWSEDFECNSSLRDEFVSPEYILENSRGVTDLHKYNGDILSSLNNKLLGCSFSDSKIYVYDISASGNLSEIGFFTIPDDESPISIAESKEGRLFLSTSTSIYEIME